MAVPRAPPPAEAPPSPRLEPPSPNSEGLPAATFIHPRRPAQAPETSASSTAGPVGLGRRRPHHPTRPAGPRRGRSPDRANESRCASPAKATASPSSSIPASTAWPRSPSRSTRAACAGDGVLRPGRHRGLLARSGLGGELDLGRDFRSLRTTTADNLLAVKLTYWLGL